jgi:hypothetical protein
MFYLSMMIGASESIINQLHHRSKGHKKNWRFGGFMVKKW